MKRRFGLGILSIVLLALLGACGSDKENQSEKTESDQLQIITTFYPIYDFTKNIVGNEADVEMLIPAGTEPHDWEPSAKDMAKIQEADVFVYHDPNLESWAPKVAKSREDKVTIQGTKKMTLQAMEDAADENHEHGEAEHNHELDPHTWLDPTLAIKEVKTIEQQLIEAYPDKKKIFQTNAGKYLAKLEKLDNQYKKELENAKQKTFVTQHAAFGYLASQYGLKQVAITGLSADQEPSPKRLAELKTYVKENDIQYIYFEENANDKIAQTLANEANVKSAVLNPLESLTEKQLKSGENYISVMEDNLKALKKTTETTKSN